MTEQTKENITAFLLMCLMIGAIIFVFYLVSLNPTTEIPKTIPQQKSEQEMLLEAEGYENIRMTDLPLFICSEDDSVFFNKGFEATKNGKHFQGAVCGAFLKGHTIRISKVY